MTDVKRISRDLSNFSKIDMRGAGDIQLTQGQDFSFAILAEDAMHDIITTEIEDETLIIAFEDTHKSIEAKKTIIYEITMPLIAGVRIAGGGSLHCERIGGKTFTLDLPGGTSVDIGTIAVVDYILNIKGAAKIKTKNVQASQVEIDAPGTVTMSIEQLDADHLDIQIKGTANMSLAGRVVSQSYALHGVGNIKAGDLSSKTASVRSAGLVNVSLAVDNSLDVRISGAGQVRYYGNPVVTKKVSGLGRVKQIGEAKPV